MSLFATLSSICGRQFRPSIPKNSSVRCGSSLLLPLSSHSIWTTAWRRNLGRESISPAIFSSLNRLDYQTRDMSKYLSKSAKKRLNLTTKRAHKGFYKGKGGTQEGRINSKGRFIVNHLKRLELVVPDLAGFRLKPYIAASASKYPPEERHGRL